MPVSQLLLVLVCVIAIGLFGFQLWRVWQTGHVRWRVQKHHRDHRPVAFWIEVAACAVGALLFAALLIWTLARWWSEAG